MSKKKYWESSEAKVDFVPEVETAPANDAVLLKINHTHGGVQYPKGTAVEVLGASESSLEYMRNHGVI